MARTEVELKLRADHDVLRPRLRRLGFARSAYERHVDRYLDVPHRDLAVTDEALRIRTVTDLETDQTHAILAYKGPREEASRALKSRVEHRCRVKDATTLLTIARAMDCDLVGPVTKRRERFDDGTSTVTLDEVEGIGRFVEIERVVAATDRTAAAHTIETLMTDLGLEGAPREERTYLDLVLNDSQ